MSGMRGHLSAIVFVAVAFVAMCVRSFIEARKARQAGFPVD